MLTRPPQPSCSIYLLDAGWRLNTSLTQGSGGGLARTSPASHHLVMSLLSGWWRLRVAGPTDATLVRTSPPSVGSGTGGGGERILGPCTTCQNHPAGGIKVLFALARQEGKR